MSKIRHGKTKRHRLGMAARNGGLGLRSVLWLRHHGHYWYCGASVPRDEMTMDHILPVAQGGIATLDNVVLACKPCNGAKGAMSREAYRVSLGAGTRFWGERAAGVAQTHGVGQTLRALSLAAWLLGVSLGCTAQQWETTKGVLALTAVVGILAIGESQCASYRPLSTECHSVCTPFACESRCVTQ